jgi:hypothetical protein
MKKAVGRVCLFAPQAYWMGYPGNPHYTFDPAHFTVRKYPRDDPSAFVRLVIDAWEILGIATPLVISGQTYWELRKKADRRRARQEILRLAEDHRVQLVPRRPCEYGNRGFDVRRHDPLHRRRPV